MSEETQGTNDEQLFETIAAVLEYLETSGWKVTKTSLYRHQGEGKLLPKENGSFRKKDVDKYAKTFLKEQSTGKKVKTLEDALQRKKLEADLRNLDLEHERKKLQHDRELGKYILREKMEIELAARAGILEAGLKHWIQSGAAGWLRLGEGNVKKAGELISAMIRDLDEHINGYAQAREYELVIDGEEVEIESDT
jgi:hypothetical protein